MAITSPLGVQSIGASVRSLGIAVTRVKRSAITSSNILMNRTKVKRSSIFEGRRLFQRKKESIRRKDQENIIELSTLTTPIKRGTAAIARSTQGFLGRVLEFTATLLTGWLLYNLPTLIAMTKELMGRITRMVEILKGFVGNLGNIMTGFGNVLGAVFQNVTSFDFLDTSKRVETAMKGLNNTFDDMGAQIDEGMRLLTTSLGEGLVTGEQAPSFGTRFPAQPETTPSGSLPSAESPEMYRIAAALSTEGSGPQSTVDMMQVVVNRKASGRYGASYTDILAAGESVKRSQFQGVWKRPGGPKAFRKIQTLEDAVRWSGQSKTTLLRIISDIQNPTLQANSAKFVGGAFEFRASPQNNPSGRLPGTAWRGGAGDNQFLTDPSRGDPIRKEGPASFNLPAPVQPTVPSSKPQSPVKPVTPIITSRMGEMRGSRRHGGTDLATNSGTPLRAVSDGVIVDSGKDPSGWGNFIVIKDNQNIYHLYAHIQNGYKRSGNVRKGEEVAKVGMTGKTTGPHLHWETGTGWNGYVLSGKFDPLNRYSKFAPFNTTPTSAIQSPAQIAAPPQQRRQQLPGQITPERQGPQIVLIDDVQPQQLPMPMSGGGGGGIIPIVINPLNRYITNKLLLDLAYT